MACFSPVGFGVKLMFRALDLCGNRPRDCGETSVLIVGNYKD